MSWKGKENESKEDCEILESLLAESERESGENKKKRVWSTDRANDYRIVWITRAQGEQRMSKGWVEVESGEEKK